MAAESGREATSLVEKMFDEPRRFDFLQVVRILRATHPSARHKIPADEPRDELLRFASHLSFAFPTSDVAKLERPSESRDTPRLEVTFMGLSSPHSLGSLPTPYIMAIADEPRREDSPLRDLLEIFDHRLISLYFGSVAKLDPLLQMESGDSFYERALAAICGIGTAGLRNRVALDDRALLARAGLLAMQPMPAIALTSLLESYFEVPFEIDDFLPCWFAVSEEDRTQLGVANSILGDEVYLGDSIELCQSKFRIRTAPLSWERYRGFFADGSSFRALLDLIETATPTDQNFEIQLVLSGPEVPSLQLTRQPRDESRLGWSTWLSGGEQPEDRSDAILTALSWQNSAGSADTVPNRMEN